MNRADRMLEALADGEPRSRHSIFAAAGCFFLTNNAAAELRERGYVVEQFRDGEEFMYRLSLSSPEETERLWPSSRSSGDLSESGGHVPKSRSRRPLKQPLSLDSSSPPDRSGVVEPDVTGSASHLVGEGEAPPFAAAPRRPVRRSDPPEQLSFEVAA